MINKQHKNPASLQWHYSLHLSAAGSEQSWPNEQKTDLYFH